MIKKDEDGDTFDVVRMRWLATADFEVLGNHR